MKRSISNMQRRLATLVVGVAALLLMSGCRNLHSTCFQKVSNPRVCPVCMAAAPDQCNCFPNDVGAGYSETHWGKLASPDPQGSMFMFDSAVSPVTEVPRHPSETMPEVVVARRRMSEPRELVELVKLAEPIEPAELVQLADFAELVELAESVDLAQLPDGDRD